MIVVCPCGQKSRIVDLSTVNKIRCRVCRQALGAEATRQAARNAHIVLAVAAILTAKERQGCLTKEEDTIAHVFAQYETGR